MPVERQAHRHGRMVGRAEHHRRTALGQGDDEIGGPGHAVGVDDHGRDVVEGNAPDFLPPLAHDQEAAQDGEVAAIGGDVDDALHDDQPGSRLRGPGSQTRPSSSIRTWRADQAFSVPGEG